MGMMISFHANICSASFSSSSTLHLIGVLISSLEQQGALRRLGGEIRWAETLSEWNHVPHFPYFVTHYVDSMPIASILFL